jgi:hypothetical protein
VELVEWFYLLAASIVNTASATPPADVQISGEKVFLKRNTADKKAWRLS